MIKGLCGLIIGGSILSVGIGAARNNLHLRELGLNGFSSETQQEIRLKDDRGYSLQKRLVTPGLGYSAEEIRDFQRELSELRQDPLLIEYYRKKNNEFMLNGGYGFLGVAAGIPFVCFGILDLAKRRTR